MRRRSLRESIDRCTVLKHAVSLWKQGHYIKAVDLCRKYGVSDNELHKATSKFTIIRETELQVVGKEKKKSLLDKNIIRALQTPVSTAAKPSLDSAIMEALSKK